MDKLSNRQIITELVQNDIKENNGVSQRQSFIGKNDGRRENYEEIFMGKINIAVVRDGNGLGVSDRHCPILRDDQR